MLYPLCKAIIEINAEISMNPCKECMKMFGEPLCTDFGHCVFEGTNEEYQYEHADSKTAYMAKNTLLKQDGADSTVDSL